MEKNRSGNEDYNYIQGKFMSNVSAGEEILITGLAGTFPNSHDVYEFQENLFNKVNMVQPNKRWDFKHPQIPECSGTIPEIDKYDTGFFGIHQNESETQDILSRKLIEKSVEAIFDAGLNLEDLKNTNSGVYVGTCFSEMEINNLFSEKKYRKNGFSGCTRSSIAHRISYFLKLKGPSFITDTACSSSLFALENAFRDLRLGVVDTAIICGANLCFHPIVSLQFSRLGVLSMDGSCKVFDAAGDGYARSEAICAIIIQKRRVAKRNYGQIVYAKTNCDGFKETSITYPSGEVQKNLLTEFYRDSGINPADLSFLEAHGTGTFVGDPEECRSIDEVFGKCRKDPLLIGSVKSNIGHSEPASGLCSITKCIIGFETGYIPPNIHFKTPRESLIGIIEGRLQVVSEKMPLKDNKGLIGINSFGFGGGNCHVLIKANDKQKIDKGIPKDDIPRLICISGRTLHSITYLLDELKSNTLDAEYVRLIHNVFRKNIPNHIYRGYSIVSKSGELCRFIQTISVTKAQLYFVFGEFSEWFEAGRKLQLISSFSKSIDKLQKLLLSKGVDVHKTLFDNYADRSKNHVLGSILVQIGLLAIFEDLDIKPSNYFGYSYGELLAAYSNGIITIEQTIECALVINDVVDTTINSHVSMEATKAVNGNSENGANLDKFRSSFISNECLPIKNQLLANLSSILKKIQIGKPGKKIGLAEYLVNALSQKSFDKIDNIEKNSIVITIGYIPNLESNMEDIKIIPIAPPEDINFLEGFLRTTGNLYMNGYNPQVAKLYPEINFPVSKGTRMISPFIKWKHERTWFVPLYNLKNLKLGEICSRLLRVQLDDQQYNFIEGHTIDGRILFPATGYLYIVWETLSMIEDISLTMQNIVFEDVRFLRATTLSLKGHNIFEIIINKISGKFEIIEGGSLVVTGKMFAKSVECEPINALTDIPSSPNTLTSKDIYKEFRLRGYNYSGDFRSIQEFNPEYNVGLIKWKDNWIAFMDNMLQMNIFQSDTRLLYVPTYISQMIVPAKSHFEWVTKNFLEKQKEPLLPVSCDPISKDVRCGGIVIKGLIANSIPRRKDLGIPVLEKYQFVPNVTTLTLNESIRINMQILLENNIINKVKCVELIDEFTKDSSTIIPIIQAAFEDQPLIQPIVKILTKNQLQDIEGNIPIEDKELDTETDCNLIVGSRLLERSTVLKMAYESLKVNSFLVSREPEQLDIDIFTTKVNDFTIFTIHKTPEETIVLLKKCSKTKDVFALDVSSSEELDWVQSLQDIIKKHKSDNVVLYTQNPLSGILGFVNCIRREPETSYIRALFVMDDAEEFNKNSPFYKQQLDKNMAINIWKNNTWGTYRHLPLDNLENVKSEHLFVNTTSRGDLSTIKWIESNLKKDMITPPEKTFVHVHYAPLNFRDIMTATAKITVDVITTNRLEQECIQGIEFSGYTSDGRRVMGMGLHGQMSTLNLADEYLLYDVPDTMSLKEAATIPVVYTTVFYGLFMRSKLKKGQTILIHSGTGGVGQAAIRVALYYGCTVFTTVSTAEKREFLLKTFPQLKTEHIGNSRDLSFEHMIRKYTKGRGVDVVLNSLAEEKLIASVRCLARGGNFVEIGKFDFGKNNMLSMSLLKKDATFHGIMLDEMLKMGPQQKIKVAQYIKTHMGKCIVPLPISCFGYNQVEEAFRYMSTGKHIGKVMIQIREEDKVPQAAPEYFVGFPRYFCDSEKTYIIVGGLGGFGLELADWLILKGAKNLVLTSRKGLSTGYQKARMRIWKSYGTVVHISQEDICTEEGCRNLLEQANKLGDVDAIFNLAVILADAIFENQTEESFKTSLGPKAVATNHLDKLSRILCPKLKDFVIFSSVSCGRGNAGQTNYGMANSIMERICEKRKSDGYPALAIQWGAIGDVGLVAELQEEHIQLEIGGTLQQKISSCLNVLNNFLRHRDVTIVSSVVVAEKRGGLSSCDNVVDSVLNILGITDAKIVSPHATLPELGMDSMTGVEIKQTLEREFEIFLSPKDIKSITLAKIKEIQEKRCLDEEETVKPVDVIDWEIILKNLNTMDLMSTEIVLKSNLSEDTDGPTLLIFPGIEGYAQLFSQMATHLNAHVVVYQYWEKANFNTVDDIILLLLPKVLQRLEKNKTFNIIGFSMGSIFAIEIVNKLESMGYTGKLIIIDGGPTLMHRLLHNYDDKPVIFETELIWKTLMYFTPKTKVLKEKRRIFECSDWNDRLILAEEIMKNASCSPENIAENKMLMEGTYNRFKICQQYIQFSDKLKTKIILYKPSKQIYEDIEDDYGISQITDSPIEIKVFDGNHSNIIENEMLAKEVDSVINN
ncbi:fatty acid synthase-like [Diorhabda sublineata]|uniref:fatty acid synthase-like n=1 Tax=Diorhabda sublineata TaxID=1163346 RepID=UPI0024E04176|nr:fatty acid synthase-like [Diorhabda sublineata]